MECPRCRGYMYVEHLPHAQTGEQYRLRMWACLNCGERFDEQILSRRRETREKQRTFQTLWNPLFLLSTSS